MAGRPSRPDASILTQHWCTLCTSIGTRLAGSPQERAAADYVESRFRAYGLANVRQERFGFPNWWERRVFLCAGQGKPFRGRRVVCTPWVYSPSTPRCGVSGELVYLEGALPLNFATQKLRGRIGLAMGNLSMQDEAFKQRLNASGLAGLIYVDSRILYDQTYPGGAAPQWVGGLKVPIVCVPFLTASDLLRDRPLRVELTVEADHTMDFSQNVIGEVIGGERPEEVVVVSGHHDCVAGTVGANDNASGVLYVLEMARVLSRTRPRRTVRFISYGVEERLSVGSYVYARGLGQAEARRIRAVVNLDSAASRVGVDRVEVGGTAAFFAAVRGHYERSRHPALVVQPMTIFSDHFPLTMRGVPTIYLRRMSVADSGHWNLHTRYDNLDHVDPAVLARTVKTTASLVHGWCAAERFPFPRRLGPAIARVVRDGARDIYRHPWPVKRIDGVLTMAAPDARWGG
jgi:hypothetical protein